ncbi:MAG: PAS domain S-box protein, partial [Clostridia bacterium]|nr:PAS domain S-box protein [Clostridia bacterium]
NDRIEFEKFIESRRIWIQVNLFSTEKNYYLMQFTDISHEKKRLSTLEKLVRASDDFLQMDQTEIDYQKVCDDFLDLMEAKIVVFNLFDENGKSFTAKALSGDRTMIKTAGNLLGFQLDGKKWDYHEVTTDEVKRGTIIRFSNLTDFASHIIAKPLLFLIEKLFNTGEFILIKIICKDVILGDFIITMDKDTLFDKDNIAKIFTRQLGMTIMRNRIKEKLVENESLYQTFIDTSTDMIYLKDEQYKHIVANRQLADFFGKDIDEIIGKSDFELMPFDYAKSCRQADMLALANKGVNISEEIIEGKVFEARKFPVKLNNNKTGVGGFIRDISYNKKIESELSNEKNVMDAIFKSIPGIIFLYDDQSRLVRWNKNHEEITGYTAEEMANMHILDWVKGDEESQKAVLEGISKTLTEGLGDTEAYLQRKDGTKIHMYYAASSIYINGEQFIAGIGIDISKHKQYEENLRASEEKYRLLTENASDVIWVYNFTKDRYSYISPSIVHLRGYTAEEAMKENIHNSIDAESILSIESEIKRSLNEFIAHPDNHKVYFAEIKQFCKNGDPIWVEISARYRYNEDGDIEAVGVSRNITERKKAQEEILHLSYHDHLTGLYNRRYFEEELKKKDIAENLPIALVMADVNGLKLVNDSFGHKMGDELLIKAAESIKSICRSDDIASRLGGDEFIMILPKVNESDVERKINQIKEHANSERTGAVDVSISFGYDLKKEMGKSIIEVFKNAEDDMYRHKLYESSSMRSRTIDIIMNTLYEKSNREMLHSKRVGDLCEIMATKMGYDKDIVKQIRIAGFMHDIGKIGIDEKILNKEGKLSQDEWKEMKKHPEIGYRILSSSNEFSEIAEYVLQHQEKWDGTGYPQNLAGEKIAVQARIIAIADSFDAMTSDRPYRKGLSISEAVNEIIRYAGIQFDSSIAAVFIKKCIPELS